MCDKNFHIVLCPPPQILVTLLVDSELNLYFAHCKTYALNKELDFCTVNEMKYRYPMSASLTQNFLSAPVSEAYLMRTFSVCGQLTADKRNLLTKGMENKKPSYR